MLGKIIPYVGLAYVQTALILVLVGLVFDVPVRGSIPLLLLALGVFIACNLALGVHLLHSGADPDAGAADGAVRAAAVDHAVGLHVPVPGHAALGALGRRGDAADAHAAHLPRRAAEGQRPAGDLAGPLADALFALVVGAIAVSLYRETLD